MNDRSVSNSSPIILGKSFLSTIQTKIDVSKVILTIEFVEEVIHFNIFDAMKYPINSHFMFVIYTINLFVREFSESNYRGKLKIVATKHHGLKVTYDVKMDKKLKKVIIYSGDLDPGEISSIARKFELQLN